ncbi:MAG: hypothetical protein KJ065_20605 [Anaerolineae bacterium]|nr:hypothetical protein [Anaerolineae bacterium]
MKRHYGLLIAVLLLLALALPLAAQEEGPPQVGQRPDAPEYALHGPYWVGTMLIEAETEFHPTKIQILYPALNPDGVEEEVTYPHDYWTDQGDLPVYGHAIEDAPPDVEHGPYPLVIFGHGLNAGRYESTYLYEHLASYGFVVMSMDYVDNFATAGMVPFETIFYTRPQDISWQISYASQLTDTGGMLQDAIDLERVAAVGVSQGGLAALSASGARFNFNAFRTACSQNPQIGQLALTLGGGNLCTDQAALVDGVEHGMVPLAGLDSVPEGMWPSWTEERLDAAVYLAPTSIFFGRDGLHSVQLPTLMIGGTVDAGVTGPPEVNFVQAHDALGSSEKALVMFSDAGHFIYDDDCAAMPWAFDLAITWYCSDPVWDMDRAHDLINHFTTAFLLDVLKGDEAAHAALAPDAVSFPGITYEAEGF